MEIRNLGSSGLKISAISYGNWLTHGSQVEEDAALACVRQGGELTVYSGRQKLVLSWRDLQAHEGARASRGHLLPRGFQRVDSVEST